MEFLGGMAKAKDFAGLLRWAGSSAVVMATIGKLFGWRPEDIIPSVGLGSPITQLVGAGAKAISPDEARREEGVRELKGMAALGVPAGVQARKTLRGIRLLKEGGAYTKTGRLRFPTPEKGTSKLMAPIVGQWASPEAREYIKRGFQPLGEKQTARFQAQLRAGRVTPRARKYYSNVQFQRDVNKIKKQIKEKKITLKEGYRQLAELKRKYGK